MTEEQTLEAVAYHEAGHFVAGIHFHSLQPSITIIPNEQEGYLGCVLGEGSDCFIDSEGNLLPGILEDCENQICISMAGYIAETKKFNSSKHDPIAKACAGSDFENVERLANEICIADSRVEELKLKTGSIISERWEQVKLLAEMLLTEKRMDGDAAEIICEIAAGEKPGELAVSHYPFLVEAWEKASASA